MSPKHDPTTEPAGLPVLWLDNSCLVLNKPGGISTQAPHEFDSVEGRVRRWLAERATDDQTPYLGLPHRLDRGTSGVLLLALRQKVARKLSRQFERREVVKRYWALVEGEVHPPAGSWRDYVRKVPQEPRGEVVESHVEGARLALLDYRVMAHHGACSWLELRLHTGRMHQIRLQAAHRGHAILGDQLYGSTQTFGPEVEDERAKWLALHAHALTFRHPASGNQLTIEAPMPKSWQALAGLA